MRLANKELSAYGISVGISQLAKEYSKLKEYDEEQRKSLTDQLLEIFLADYPLDLHQLQIMGHYKTRPF